MPDDSTNDGGLRLGDRIALHELRAHYTLHYDAGELDAFVALFVDDGMLQLGPVGFARGHDALRTALAGPMAEADFACHFTTDEITEFTGDDTARGSAASRCTTAARRTSRAPGRTTTSTGVPRRAGGSCRGRSRSSTWACGRRSGRPRHRPSSRRVRPRRDPEMSDRTLAGRRTRSESGQEPSLATAIRKGEACAKRPAASGQERRDDARGTPDRRCRWSLRRAGRRVRRATRSRAPRARAACPPYGERPPGHELPRQPARGRDVRLGRRDRPRWHPEPRVPRLGRRRARRLRPVRPSEGHGRRGRRRRGAVPHPGALRAARARRRVRTRVLPRAQRLLRRVLQRRSRASPRGRDAAAQGRRRRDRRDAARRRARLRRRVPAPESRSAHEARGRRSRATSRCGPRSPRPVSRPASTRA